MLKKMIELEGKNRHYVSLDDLNVRALAKSDPAMFFQIHQPPVFIDEVQYAPELFTYIKISVDQNQRSGDFWMSSSQLFKLMQGVQESLAGRVALLHLSPLSQQEIYNVLKRTIKTPKLYFYDTGLVCYLTKWSSSETAMNGAMNGALLENYVISEIKKSYQNTGKESYLYYYRDKDTKEIDYFSVIEKSPLQRGTGAVICTAEKFGAFDRDDLIIPVGLI